MSSISASLGSRRLRADAGKGRGVDCYRVSDAAFTGNAFDATMVAGTVQWRSLLRALLFERE
jgi:hypothetical protein